MCCAYGVEGLAKRLLEVRGTALSYYYYYYYYYWYYYYYYYYYYYSITTIPT